MHVRTIALLASLESIASVATAAPPEPYPAMAPLAQYLMPEADEVALARSAAPKSVSDDATVMVLTDKGYVVAAKGTNGFLCLVQRGWAGDSAFADFWNPRQRAPNCFNAAAADTYVPIYLMKTRLVLDGKSRKEATQAAAAALDSGQLPALAPGAMCYMMSRQQYLNDEDKAWQPHMMVFERGDVGKTWGANLPGSPVIASNDPEERVTIMMIPLKRWSDGTPVAAPAPAMNH